MALRARQEQQLHLAIALYLESKFPEAHRAFEKEAHIDFSAALGRSDEKFDSETLPKRWAATARLQARVTVLQNQLNQQEHRLNLFTSAAAGAGSKKPLLAGADDGNVRVRLGAQEVISVEGSSSATISRTFRAHHASVTGLAFDSSGRWLVTCSSDMTLRLFDVQASYTLKQTLKGHEDCVSAAVFFAVGFSKAVGASHAPHMREFRNNDASEHSADKTVFSESTCVVSCSRDGTIKLWDTQSGLCLKTFNSADSAGGWGGGNTAGAGGSWVRCICVPDVKLRPAPFFASGGNDQRIVMWRPDFSNFVRELVGHEHVVESVTFATEEMLRYLHNHRKAPPPLPISMLDAKALQDAEHESKNTHVLRIAGLVLISGSRDKTIRIWDVIGGSCMQTLIGHDNWVRQVVVHPTGERIISCSDDRSIRTWNVLTGDCERTLSRAHSQFVTCLAYDAKADILASASLDATVKLWSCRHDDAEETNEIDEVHAEGSTS